MNHWIERVQKTQHGFTDIKKATDEILAQYDEHTTLEVASEFYQSEVYQARMLAVFLYGAYTAKHPEILLFLRDQVSLDADWRVQEILAQAFDQYCKDTGYQTALPIIREWLSSERANVRRAASEGLRIWTTRPYFKDHPKAAIELLSPLRGDDSEYVRKSVGNALRDISRKHPDLIRVEVAGWDLSDKRIAQTYKLASKFVLE